MSLKEISRSAVSREAIKKKVGLLDKFRQFTSESTMTEEDAIALGKAVNAAARKKHDM